MSSCSSDTTYVECGYLTSARYSACFAGIFSFCATLGYYHIATNFEMYAIPGFYWTIVGTLACIQCILAFMCTIFFYCFTDAYLTQNDDLNIEIPEMVKPTSIPSIVLPTLTPLFTVIGWYIFHRVRVVILPHGSCSHLGHVFNIMQSCIEY